MNSAKVQNTRVTRLELAQMVSDQITSAAEGLTGLVLIEIASFHYVNTTLGYAAGQSLIDQLCERLLGQFRPIDQVVALGHGQIALILPNLKNANHALLAAAKVRRGIAHARLEDAEVSVMPTLGVAVHPVHAEKAEVLVQRADVALEHTVVGHHPVQLASSVEDDKDQQLAMVQDLERAIEENELTLNFQPQIDLKTGAPSAVEALSRWKNARQGFVPPDVFIAVAESCGLIKPLTVWSLNSALKTCQGWQGRWPDCSMAINLSAVLLHDAEIVELIQRSLNIWSMPAHQMVVEITEGAVMGDPERCLSTMKDLHQLGVVLSIDDFGTGYSSMSYLSKLPLDELKIDKSFVMDMNEDRNNEKIVRTVIDLAHNLNLRVVAEGIENAKTLRKLQDLGCNYAQGYHIAKPLPRSEVMEWYTSHAPLLADS